MGVGRGVMRNSERGIGKLNRKYWYEVTHVEEHRVTRLIQADSKKQALNFAEWGDVGKEVHKISNDFVPFKVVSAKKAKNLKGYQEL